MNTTDYDDSFFGAKELSETYRVPESVVNTALFAFWDSYDTTPNSVDELDKAVVLAVKAVLDHG